MIKTEIISLKKLKKDGSIDQAIVRSLAQTISLNKTVLMPVDSIYGIVALQEEKTCDIIDHVNGLKSNSVIRMISSFKMLDELASVSKMEYDFLHRIWPGELVVVMKDITDGSRVIPVCMPRGKFKQDIIEHVGRPFFYAPMLDAEKKPVYRKKDMISLLEGKVDSLLIIDEFCKEHGLPTIVDISKGTLSIVHEGRVSAEEIKSLYFLGKDDSAV
jgi:tRNA A37 threonylcarbamoyladenosine synthetase subunit TsaC/SUA5/YrdC